LNFIFKGVNMLIKYVRDKKRRPIGAIVALDKVSVGWSKCSKHDLWNKKIALNVAAGRAEASNYRDIFYNIPHSFKKDIEWMRERAKREFSKL